MDTCWVSYRKRHSKCWWYVEPTSGDIVDAGFSEGIKGICPPDVWEHKRWQMPDESGSPQLSGARILHLAWCIVQHGIEAALQIVQAAGCEAVAFKVTKEIVAMMVGWGWLKWYTPPGTPMYEEDDRVLEVPDMYTQAALDPDDALPVALPPRDDGSCQYCNDAVGSNYTHHFCETCDAAPPAVHYSTGQVMWPNGSLVRDMHVLAMLLEGHAVEMLKPDNEMYSKLLATFEELVHWGFSQQEVEERADIKVREVQERLGSKDVLDRGYIHFRNPNHRSQTDPVAMEFCTSTSDILTGRTLARFYKGDEMLTRMNTYTNHILTPAQFVEAAKRVEEGFDMLEHSFRLSLISTGDIAKVCCNLDRRCVHDIKVT